jgi:thioesterase-3
MLEVIVRTSHLDLMGHVNNAKYVEFLEWGRCDELEKIGIDLLSMIREGTGMAVVNLNINFRREAFYGDHLLIETTLKEIRNQKIGILQQSITRKESGEVVCDAEVTFLFLDLKAHKSIAMPENFRRLLPDASVSKTETPNPDTNV